MKLHCNEEKYDDDVINVAELDIANSLLRRELNLRGNCLLVVKLTCDLASHLFRDIHHRQTRKEDIAFGKFVLHLQTHCLFKLEE